MARLGKNSGSTLLVDEYFTQGDDQFIAALKQVHAPKSLAGVADRWKRDGRPWAREQIFKYLSQPLDAIGHNVVVKRLFKHAEEQQDDEVMGAFLVAFDRLVRRVRKKSWQWDWQTRQSYHVERLVSPPNILPMTPSRWWTPPGTYRLFSYATRYYLRRRAWRYFRRTGFQRPEAYVPTISSALMRYQDADLEKGENILDSWGLMQACFRDHDALEFDASRIRLKSDRSLSELSPAPRFAHLWKEPQGFRSLLNLLTGANSRFVRVWARQLLEQEHEDNLTTLTIDELMSLLESDDEEVQAFAASILKNSGQLATLPLERWFRLLKVRNIAALEMICEAMKSHVAPERLSLEECVSLAMQEPTPIAELGLNCLEGQTISTAEQRQAIAQLASAPCYALGRRIAQWAWRVLTAPGVYDRDLAMRFLDSLSQPIRQAVWERLLQEDDGAASRDPVIWTRLLETPYSDIRLGVVDELHRRASLPGVGRRDLRPLWAAVLSGVDRGNRQKMKAASQLADAIIDNPALADDLLPVLTMPVRSIRDPESRAGLAAVVRVAGAAPELAEKLGRLLPELSLTQECTP